MSAESDQIAALVTATTQLTSTVNVSLASLNQNVMASVVAAFQPVAYSLNGVTSFNAIHSFPYNPQTLLITPSGSLVETDTAYTTGNVNLIFALPFTGTLYLK